MEEDEKIPKRMITGKHVMLGSGILTSIWTVYQLDRMYMRKDVAELAIKNINVTMKTQHGEEMDAFKELKQMIRESEASSEARHNRDIDRLTLDVQALQAARMGVGKTKNN